MTHVRFYGGVLQYSGPLTDVTGSYNTSAYCAASQIVRACDAAGCSAWSSPPFPQQTKIIGEPGNLGNPLSIGDEAEGESLIPVEDTQSAAGEGQ